MNLPRCLSCKHLYIEGSTPAYSDLTPGDSMAWRCTLQYELSIDEREFSRQSVKKFFLAGEACNKYEEEGT